jgi:hypothetical protein
VDTPFPRNSVPYGIRRQDHIAPPHRHVLLPPLLHLHATIFFVRPRAELSTADRLRRACHGGIEFLVRFGGATLHELTVSDLPIRATA